MGPALSIWITLTFQSVSGSNCRLIGPRKEWLIPNCILKHFSTWSHQPKRNNRHQFKILLLVCLDSLWFWFFILSGADSTPYRKSFDRIFRNISTFPTSQVTLCISRSFFLTYSTRSSNLSGCNARIRSATSGAVWNKNEVFLFSYRASSLREPHS